MQYLAPKTVLELLKPVTWFPPMFAFIFGVVSSGRPVQERWLFVLAGILLTGPLVCGTSQAVNDWFDRHVDAINEPNRPIPSGRMPGQWGYYIALLWSVLSLCVAAALGQLVFYAALFGLVLAWAYSAPPFRLKQNGWWGNAAVALCYEGLPWFTGATVMSGALPGWQILTVAGLYSLGAHGIMTLNDFKSVEGDAQLGVRSLPVQLGVNPAARLACVVMAVPQIIVAALLVHAERPLHAIVIAALLLTQFALMVRLLANPRQRAVWYSGFGVGLYVLGMLVSALALRPVLPEVM